jgi:hypothetical protein
MRFGVALDLWGAKFKQHDDETPAEAGGDHRPQPSPAAVEPGDAEPVNQAQHRRAA